MLFECTCIYFHTYMSYIHKTALNGHFLCMFKLEGKNELLLCIIHGNLPFVSQMAISGCKQNIGASHSRWTVFQGVGWSSHEELCTSW